ncbi:MAG: hypothetical protein JWL90_1701 [Chthoniobacteraceae bacterium]|nr:hypothetical protein [Chthoniobacteraceae bacterium]
MKFHQPFLVIPAGLREKDSGCAPLIIRTYLLISNLQQLTEANSLPVAMTDATTRPIRKTAGCAGVAPRTQNLDALKAGRFTYLPAHQVTR